MAAAGDFIGLDVDGYALKRLVGEGAAGFVFEARRGDEPRAIKVYRQELFARDADAQDARIAREADFQRVGHRNLCRVYGHGRFEVGGATWRYLLMELVDGTPLDRMIEEHGALDADVVRSVTLQLVDAVEALHNAGLVHRDIKPANILVETKTNRLVLADFGIVGDLEESGLTASHHFLGTIRYAAPEWLFCSVPNAGERPELDIYSIGATVAHMLTGAPPYQSKRNQYQLARAVADVPLHVPLGVLPTQATSAVRAMVLKDPAQRPSLEQCRTAMTSEGFGMPQSDEASEDPLEAFRDAMRARGDVQRTLEEKRRRESRTAAFYEAREALLAKWRAASDHPIKISDGIETLDVSGEQGLGRWLNADDLRSQFADHEWDEGVSVGFPGVADVVGVRVAYFLHGDEHDFAGTRFVATEPPDKMIQFDSMKTWAGPMQSTLAEMVGDYEEVNRLLTELLARANS